MRENTENTELRLLGPLELRRSGVVISLGGEKQQILLAYLCLNANRQVSITGLVEAIWGESPPLSAKKNVQLYVSRLRRLIAGTKEVRLVTAADGYLISITPDQLDVERCQRLLQRARLCLQRCASEQACALFGEALQLWRGRPLSGLSQTSVMQAEIARLEQLRLALLTDYYEAELAVGRYAGAIPDLVRLVALHPHQERLRGHLMMALWRSGQRETALATYRQVYRLMADELGIEPSRPLQLLHQAVLADDIEAGSNSYSQWISSPERGDIVSDG
ncbi:AfsR/SARP family transcriptional regulator [Streptomyces silvisoli]|uniref:AfsR/SARP family transcriptional regulator n=1 Tax=Streptomyces silvisoli TaxID=3034235 RepID=A0ABT5ZKF5_9ACTN|nr:AfsR/SARP family transcriptional regulator [Streptomyces silvisoli]MDF3290314.1 AfsR/SARP family transcriptional regulator [Streptomyces silvisoli]